MFLRGGLLSVLLSLFSCSSSPEEEQIEALPFSFREPLVSWTATPEDVRSYMSGYEVAAVTTNSLTFKGRDSESSYLYAFSSAQCTLNYVVVAFDLSRRDEVMRYLDLNYVRQDSGDGMGLFSDASGTTFIWTSQDEALYLTYMSAGYTGR